MSNDNKNIVSPNEEKLKLAQQYELGDGVEQNYYEAFRYYMLAFEDESERIEWCSKQTNPIMLNYIAESYVFQNWFHRDVAKGIALYEELAKQGDLQAMYSLSEIYSGRWSCGDVELDYHRAFNLCKTVAESNLSHERSKLTLAMMYLRGEGTECDLQKGCEWLSKSAEAGDILANYFLGMMYRYGDVVKKDTARAVELLKKALSEENAFANGINTVIYTELGEIYFRGETGSVNYKKAFEYWNKIPETAEFSKHLYYLGVCYLNGFGIDEDYKNPAVKKSVF